MYGIRRGRALLAAALMAVGLCGCGVSTTIGSTSAVVTTTTAMPTTLTTPSSVKTTAATTVCQSDTTISSRTVSTSTTVTTVTTGTRSTVKTTTTVGTTTTDAVTTRTTRTTSTTTTKATVTPLAGTTPLTELPSTEYYGYVLLGQEANGAQLQTAYRRLVAGIEAMEDVITINDDTVQLTSDELLKVWRYYRLDYPQHFWPDGGFSYEEGTGILNAIVLYRMDKATRDSRRADMEKTVEELLTGVSGSWSDYQRELAIHDALCARVTYRDDGQSAHNADGALIEGVAVCEGYAEAFQYLMYRAGIQCLGVIGTVAEGDHKWNAVHVDGNYYYVDVTWDDPGGTQSTVTHSYFNVNTALLQRDHRVDQGDGYPLPACNAIEANYFKRSGGWLTEFSVDAVADHLKKNGGVAEFYVAEDTAEAFVDWFYQHSGEIADKANLPRAFSLTFGHDGFGVKIYMK